MNRIADHSVDMILADLPYGTTRNKWDVVIPFDKLWSHYERIIKPNGAIVLTAQTPFDKLLGASNPKLLKYEWIWEKTSATGFLNAKKAPLKSHENILVFYKSKPTYNPQKTEGHKPVNSYTKHSSDGTNYGKTQLGISGGGNTDRYPRSVIKFASDKQKLALHPNQKPEPLWEYLIKTYTNEGDLVVDNTAGVLTTAVACENLNRFWICIESDRETCIKGWHRLLANRDRLKTLPQLTA